MKISEAISILKHNGYIVESSDFSKLDMNRFGHHFKSNRPSKEKRNIYSQFADPGKYNDKEGIKWTYIKKRDDFTLKCAIVDGLIDVKAIKNLNYVDINSPEQIDEIIKTNDKEWLVNEILNYLHQYMKGTTTVYRGFNLSETEKPESFNINSPSTRKWLLDILSNTNKEFNSFSTDINVSYNFMGYNGIIIAADVEPNDIMFAFTAYLMGRHGGDTEKELNISNMKALRNVHIMSIQDIMHTKGYKTVFKLADGSTIMSQDVSSERGILLKGTDRFEIHFNFINLSNGKKIIFFNNPEFDGYFFYNNSGKKITAFPNTVPTWPYPISDHYFYIMDYEDLLNRPVYKFSDDYTELELTDYIIVNDNKSLKQYLVKKGNSSYKYWVDGEMKPIKKD